MKKLIALAMVLVLVLAFAACGGDDKPTAEAVPPVQEVPEADVPKPDDNDDVSGGAAMASLISWMIDGKYSYDYEMTVEGVGTTTYSTGSMAADGDKFMSATKMEVEGQSVESKVIVKDGMTYIVDDVNKMVMKFTGIDTNVTEGLVTDYSGITMVGSGNGDVDGRSLPYEEYKSSGVSVKYYMDGGQVYAIVSEFEGIKTTMIITNTSQSVPAGAFDIPADYTEMTM